MRLVWTPEALDDRRAIYDYVEADSPSAALALDELLSQKTRSLVDHPGLGRPGRVVGTRELVAHRNYILIYDTVGAFVRVLRLLHAARQWPPAPTIREPPQSGDEHRISLQPGAIEDPP
ncbi:MAG: type II toxin-antitoxin system RelE/ParE family toxin [Phreatobacter sp.]